MTSCRTTSKLSEPIGETPISESAISYVCTRNRLRAFDILQKEFTNSEISQSTLARRLKKDPGRLSRLLNAPGNLTMDTLSALLFAISGAVLKYELEYPLKKAMRNKTKPDWALPKVEWDDKLSLGEGGATTKTSTNEEARVSEVI